MDECSEDKHNCSPEAACQNTEGSFECKCNDGYQGDGKTCFGEQLIYYIPIPLEHDITTIFLVIFLNVSTLISAESSLLSLRSSTAYLI